MYLVLIDRRIKENTSVTAAITADEAFELGCLFTEALIKFRWDRQAKQGEKSLEGAREGGRLRRQSNYQRLDSLATAKAVDALLQEGMQLTAAYSLVAEQQGVSEQTIRKEYCRVKNLR